MEHRYVRDMTDSEVLAAIEEHGGIRPAARALNVGYSSLSARCSRIQRGASPSPSLATRAPSRARRRAIPTITRESLHEALVPPNLCRVREFLESLDDESREVVEEALAYPAKDFPAAAVLRWLEGLGFAPSDLPGSDAVNDHRAGRGRCRCRG